MSTFQTSTVQESRITPYTESLQGELPTDQDATLAYILELESRIYALENGTPATPSTVQESTPHTPLGDIYGHSCTAIIRWMGAQGWTNKQCMGVLVSYGVYPSPATIQTQRQRQRKGLGKVPTLTDVQVTELVDKRNSLAK